MMSPHIMLLCACSCTKTMHYYAGDKNASVNPYGTGPRRLTPVERAMSKSAGKRPPPLPPPNKGMNDCLADQLKGMWGVLLHVSRHRYYTRFSLL